MFMSCLQEAILQSPQANDFRVKQLQKRLKEKELLLEVGRLLYLKYIVARLISSLI